MTKLNYRIPFRADKLVFDSRRAKYKDGTAVLYGRIEIAEIIKETFGSEDKFFIRPRRFKGEALSAGLNRFRSFFKGQYFDTEYQALEKIRDFCIRLWDIGE